MKLADSAFISSQHLTKKSSKPCKTPRCGKSVILTVCGMAARAATVELADVHNFIAPAGNRRARMMVTMFVVPPSGGFTRVAA